MAQTRALEIWGSGEEGIGSDELEVPRVGGAGRRLAGGLAGADAEAETPILWPLDAKNGFI